MDTGNPTDTTTETKPPAREVIESTIAELESHGSFWREDRAVAAFLRGILVRHRVTGLLPFKRCSKCDWLHMGAEECGEIKAAASFATAYLGRETGEGT